MVYFSFVLVNKIKYRTRTLFSEKGNIHYKRRNVKKKVITIGNEHYTEGNIYSFNLHEEPSRLSEADSRTARQRQANVNANEITGKGF